jgi:hypothetical protein
VASQNGKLSEKQLRFKRARDPTKLMSKPSHNFANGVTLLTSAFVIQQDPWIPGQLENILERFPTNSTIRAFTEKDGEWDDTGASELIDEVRILWPEVATTTMPQDILDLQESVRVANITLEYHQICAVLVLVRDLKVRREGAYRCETVTPQPAAKRSSAAWIEDSLVSIAL